MDKTLGQIAYEEFILLLKDEPWKSWEDLNAKYKIAWEAAAELIERLTFEEYESK